MPLMRGGCRNALIDYRPQLRNGLVGYWRLEEASGTRFDATTRGNNLTDNNTVTQRRGRLENAGQFVRANQESLSIADNADLSAGDIPITVVGSLLLDSKPVAYPIPIGKRGGTVNEYQIHYANGASEDRLFFAVYVGGVEGNIQASSFGSPPTATWLFIVAAHDSVADSISVAVNDGPVDRAIYTAGIDDSNGVFRLGGIAGSSNEWDGGIDDVGVWKNVRLFPMLRTLLYRGKVFPF